MKPSRWVRVALVLGALSALPACGGGSGPGEPAPPPPPPDLTGARVMLLPVRTGSPAGLDAELRFWLTDRAPNTTWILPDELQRAADRSPAWRVDLAALPRPVAEIGGGQYQVKDPLYSAIRRLGAVEDTNVALVPVAVREVATETGPVLELMAAVVDVRAGRVAWLGTVRGQPTGGEASAASVAEALARALVPSPG